MLGEPTEPAHVRDVVLLECAHCGDSPIDPDEDGLYWDGEGGECQCCGFPGHVSVDGYEYEDGSASWSTRDWDEEAHCYLRTCSDEMCVEWRKREAYFDLMAVAEVD